MKDSLKWNEAPECAPMSDPLSVALDLCDKDAVALVRHALRHKQVKLAYQPVVQTANPDRMAFYEGLLRVHDSAGRVIPAESFIRAVEDTEMGRILDALALEKGLEVLAAEPGLRLAINMSARSIAYPRWKQVLDRGLRDNPTVGERLILEITESTAITMPDVVQVFMNELQQKGISFALDDFGAGYTSFRCLKDFYFDIMKIDGMFIRGIHQDVDNQLLTEAMLSLARHFDMFTVAKNVENHMDAAYLASIGVDCMQGYYFGVPTINPYWQKTG
ncbi:EAL domain-containing protein [Aliiroseovarius sediminis]|uniref:EAL domain-containing protein n=1 Tax=Aliiroseovarius sediminis TaxID=2925839 RepID=UPI001F57C0CF|nr:EAL domain-containing protein [Aliiroseovarius sediminis]MCI2395438.1 EAL domain-containing protein [Aliiroseovarius sediminis]